MVVVVPLFGGKGKGKERTVIKLVRVNGVFHRLGEFRIRVRGRNHATVRSHFIRLVLHTLRPDEVVVQW